MACGSNSYEDFREEGRNLSEALIQQLQQIQTREQLLEAAPKLERHFDEYVSVIIAAEEYRERHPEKNPLELAEEDRRYSTLLRNELNHVLRIEGAREVIEKCQEEALHRLDAFEKRLAKRKTL